MMLWLVAAIVLAYLALGSFAFLKGRHLSVEPWRLKDLPSISIVIPTYNEEKRIERKLSEALAFEYRKDRLEILVVDESSDRTEQIVRTLQQDHPGVIHLIRHEDRLGIAVALGQGYDAAKGSIVVKTDCDSKVLTKDALLRAISFLARPDIGAVTGVYRPTETGESNYRNLLQILQVAESNVWSTTIAHGCFTAFKKDFYEPPEPNSLADDTEVLVGVLANGHRAILLPEIVAIEENPPEYTRLLAKRARRAQGIIRVLFGSKARRAARANPLSLLILLIDTFLIVASPFLLLTLVGLVSLNLAVAGWLGDAALLALAMMVAIAWIHRRNPVASFLDAQLASAIGLLRCLRPASGIYQRIE